MSIIEQLLQRAIDKDASDVHIKCDGPPYFRVDGELIPRKRDRKLVAVGVFDRVLDCNDMALAPLVDVIDDRRERSRFSAAGRARNEHKPALKTGQSFHRRRQVQLLEPRHHALDPPHHHRACPALMEDIYPEPPKPGMRIGEVDLAVLLQVFFLRGVKQAVDYRLHFRGA